MKLSKPEKLEIQEITYNKASDVLYIFLHTDRRIAHTEPVDHGIIADFDADWNLVGIEVLWCRDQVMKWLTAPKPEKPATLNVWEPDNMVPLSREETAELHQKIARGEYKIEEVDEETKARVGRRLGIEDDDDGEDTDT